MPPPALPSRPVTALPGFAPAAAIGRQMTLDAEGRLRGASGKTYRYRKEFIANLITDPETEQFRKRWIGRRVFPYGGRVLTAQPGRDLYFQLAASPVYGMTIVDLVRVRQPGKEITYRNAGMGENELRVNDYWLVRCRPDRRDSIYAGGGYFDTSRGMPSPKSMVWTTEFVNAVHLERALSRVPPSPAVRKAMEKGVRPGQTPETVAWILGWPPVPGNQALLSQLSTWDYFESAPYDSSVIFRNGKVVRYNPPGRLP